MAVKNKVLTGDYIGSEVSNVQNKMLIIKRGLTNIPISKRTVAACTLIDSDSNKNTSNAIKRGIVGGMLAGGSGMIVGAMTGKNDKSFKVMIKFKDNKSSLLELDEIHYGILNMSLC